MSRDAFFELLGRHVSTGSIRFETPSGVRTVGRSAGGDDIVVRVADERLYRRVLALGNLGLGEAFMDGDFDVDDGRLDDFLLVLLTSRIDEKLKRDPRLLARIAALRLANAFRSQASNVRSHYDIGTVVFRSFLDETLTYSCGYACDPADDLETLQRQKLERICRKLALRDGDRLLDIGCGYGGLLIHAARHHGIRGTGVTISRDHHRVAVEQVARAGLADRITIRLGDFRDIDEPFERIVSVGMLEHVPRSLHRTYFRRVARMLTDDGRGLVHAIGCNGPVNVHDPFIQKYIFPRSFQPRLSEIARQLEINRLLILDVENIVRHYAWTVRAWRARFREAVLPPQYDARFRRMWEYYLACGVAAALGSDSAVYQVLFDRDRASSRPLARV